MPQLMPLVWINSMFMGFLVFNTLISNYYYKEEWNLIEIENILVNSKFNIKW